jgi:uncharacterized membrane protein
VPELRALALVSLPVTDHSFCPDAEEASEMRLFAIVINLAQISLILAIFLMQGLSLGGLLIVVIFVLLIFAFVNLLVLMFYTASTAIHQPLIESDKQASIKRKDLRVVYALGPRAVIHIGKQQFWVSDLSENGLRFGIQRDERCKKRIRGRVILVCGKTLSMNGWLVRREGSEAAMMFKHPVDYQTLLEEKQAVKPDFR